MIFGDLVFGCSRGWFEIPDREKWKGELNRLFEAVDPNYYEDVNYGNDVFVVMPYYWGDCTCGYYKREREWLICNPHKDSCYQKDYWNIPDYLLSLTLSDEDRFIDEAIKPLYIKHGFDVTEKNWWRGYESRCDCGRDERWRRWLEENYHSDDCMLMKPNFLYKPTGFQIKWGISPLRDGYMNQDITLEEFAKIIDDCIKSL